MILQYFADPRLVSLATFAAHGHVSAFLPNRLSGFLSLAPQNSLSSYFNCLFSLQWRY